MKHLIARHSFGAAETTSPRSGGLGGRFFAAALLCIGLASCTSDDNANGDGRTELRLSSGLTVQQVSRAGTSVQGKAFDDGEKIDVFIYENVDDDKVTDYYGENNMLEYTADGNGGLTTTETQYWPTSGNGLNIYAFYPSGLVANSKSTDAITFTVSNDQSSSDNAAYKAADLMYGVPDANPVERTSAAVNIQFTHLLSKVTVKLVQDDENIPLEGATVRLLGVQPTTTFTPSTGTISGLSGDYETFTVINKGTIETEADGTKMMTSSCIVPPQTLGMQFIMVELANGGVFVGGMNEVPTLEAGKEYKYTIKLSQVGMTVTSAITNWGDPVESDITATKSPIDLSTYKGEILSGMRLTGTTTTGITIPAGATVTLVNAHIDVTSGSAIKCEGTATINLLGTNTATTTADGKCGIEAGPENTTLTIQGSGQLTATGGYAGTGIGCQPGKYDQSSETYIQYSCGNITINGGTIIASPNKAANEYYGTGIGCGYEASCGNITINGGTVTATGYNAAGIGGGYNSSCKNIEISGGEVTATGGYAAGIGSGGGTYDGDETASCGDITISGGTVTATGGGSAAGIGSGLKSYCGNITISGGTIKATGGEYAAGIGSGNEGYCGPIEISGGTITAIGGAKAAVIGGGRESTIKNITIKSGVERITLTKGESDSYYIGKGYNGTISEGCSVTIEDGAASKIFDGDGNVIDSPINQ